MSEASATPFEPDEGSWVGSTNTKWVFRVLGRWFAIAAESVRTAMSHMRLDWWRTGNRLPRGSAMHLAWRLETAYGTSDVNASMADVIDFVEWRRRQRRARS